MVLAKVVRARYEDGVLKPLDKLELREGEEVLVEIQEDIIWFARYVRRLAKLEEEPSSILSRERERFG